MNRLNKITLKSELARKPRVEKPRPVFLAVNSALQMTMSKGLYLLLNEPAYIEFLEEEDKLYIMVSDADHGFKVFASKTSNFLFLAKPIVSRFFKNTKQRAVVFTQVHTGLLNDRPMKYYEIRLPQ